MLYTMKTNQWVRRLSMSNGSETANVLSILPMLRYLTFFQTNFLRRRWADMFELLPQHVDPEFKELSAILLWTFLNKLPKRYQGHTSIVIRHFSNRYIFTGPSFCIKVRHRQKFEAISKFQQAGGQSSCCPSLQIGYGVGHPSVSLTIFWLHHKNASM